MHNTVSIPKIAKMPKNLAYYCTKNAYVNKQEQMLTIQRLNSDVFR